MAIRALLVLSAGLLFCTAASAQAPGGGLLKGHVKAGLYEQRTESAVSGIPGVPPGQEKRVETRKRCVTQEEIDKGIELAPGCTLKTRSIAGDTAQFVSECRDGGIHEMKIVNTATGFTSDMKSSGKGRDGTPFTMTMHAESRFLGACKD